jgi:PAS domain S-box-containing protein
MDRLDTTVYFLSAILQLAAMAFALRMAREAQPRPPWLLLFAALAVMFVGRILALYVPLEIRQHFTPFISAAISSLLLIALFAIRRVTVAERQSKAAAARSAAERDESEWRYRTLVELSPDALIASFEGRIAYVNAAAVKFFGAADAKDILGRSPLDLTAGDSRPEVEARLRAILGGEGTLTPAHETWLRLDGSKVPVESMAALMPWRGGSAIQVILRDISERRRAEEERSQLLAGERAARGVAEHASHMKDEFLTTLSHELRTPLNAIVGWSELLLRENRNPDYLKEGLLTIGRNARVQAQLIEDLLDMSRIISGKLRLDIQRITPINFVEAAIDSVRPAVDAKGIRLEAMLDPLAGPVAADPNRLQQIVWNLLSNAIKFTPKGGKIQVILQRVNSHIELTVADTGQGIAPEFLPFIFDRFRQADASTTRKHSGLGIGLAIARQLAELHGGNIGVSSPGLGRGSTFAVQLPLTIIHAQAQETERLHPVAPRTPGAVAPRVQLEGIKVLVVDDEQDARELIKRILVECKAEVLTAGSAADALALLETHAPDVLVSDIGMPDIDGYAFLRQVRTKEGSGGRIPAIALTAFARSEDRMKALMSGFQMHVAKPVEPEELVATVASVAGRIAKM